MWICEWLIFETIFPSLHWLLTAENKNQTLLSWQGTLPVIFVSVSVKLTLGNTLISWIKIVLFRINWYILQSKRKVKTPFLPCLVSVSPCLKIDARKLHIKQREFFDRRISEHFSLKGNVGFWYHLAHMCVWVCECECNNLQVNWQFVTTTSTKTSLHASF